MKPGAALLLSTALILMSCGEAPRFEKWSGGDTTLGRITVTDPIVGTITSAADFAIAGSNVFVLDWRAKQIVHMQKRGNSWLVVKSFSRKGNGPGELTQPAAMDYDEHSGLIGVLERSGELELFDTAGAYVRTETLNLPCVSGRIELRMTKETRLVAERCFGGRFANQSSDTTYMVLALVSAARPPRVLVARAVSSVRGDWGSIFVATWPFSIDGDNIAFGTGLDGCISYGQMREPFSFREQCTDALIRYSAPKPRDYKGGPPTKAAAWPDPLPAFAALSHVADRVVLVRLIAADSLAFEPIASPGAYFLAGPLNTFVSCKNAGCLWYDASTEAGAMRFMSDRELTAALNRSTARN